MKKISQVISLFLTTIIALSACSFGSTPAPNNSAVSKESSIVETKSTTEEISVPKVKDDPNARESKNGILTVDDGVMREDMTSADYIKEMGIGINLGNTMESYWQDNANKTSGSQRISGNIPLSYEVCWGAVATTQEIVHGMKVDGFGNFRIPVYWGNMMDDNGEFTINDSYFDRVEEIINYARLEGLYVVINIHHYDEFIVKNYSEDEAVEIVSKLWEQIAERYSEYSDYLIFEGYNENLGTVRESDDYTEAQKFNYVNRMNKAFVDTVRASGGNNATRMLIVSGYWTNIDLTTNDKFILPEDIVQDRMMVSVHYVDNAMYWTNKIGGQEWLDYAKAQCELLKKAFTDKGIPVYVGETTSIYEEKRFAKDAIYSDTSECLEIMLDMIKEYGFIPVLWDTNDNFYSRSKYEIKNPNDKEVITNY